MKFTYNDLTDLNHYNDDSKKQMFFPSEDLHIDTIYQEPTTFEQPTQFQQQNTHPAHQENQQLLETAKEIVDVEEKQLESVLPPPSSQSCVRNLSTDLGINRRKKTSLPKRVTQSHIEITQSLDISAPVAPTSSAGGHVLFESQHSYHKNQQDNVEEPKCLNLKTPTKVTYINEEHVISSQSQPLLPPLQDIGK